MHYYPSLHQLFLDAMIVQSVSRKTSMLYIGSTEIAFSNSRRVHVTNHIPANFNKGPIEKIEGFSYGALSGTFHQYRDDIFEIMREQN